MAGFLSKRVDDWIKEVHTRDLEWFSLFESVNEYGHEILFSLAPNSNDPHSTHCRSLLS